MEKYKKILIAEDDPNDVELIMTALKENNLINDVYQVSDGEEALDYLYKRNRFADRENGMPCLLLLDLKMPKINGIEVIRQLKSDEKFKVLPIVVMTSSTVSSDMKECYQLGVNAYVVKPLKFADFVFAVKQTGVFWALINNPPVK